MFDIGDNEFLPILLAAGEVEDAGSLEGLWIEAGLWLLPFDNLKANKT